jgi:hypothetical protein
VLRRVIQDMETLNHLRTGDKLFHVYATGTKPQRPMIPHGFHFQVRSSHILTYNPTPTSTYSLAESQTIDSLYFRFT